MDEYVQAGQVSPRVGVVYQPSNASTIHAGNARSFTPFNDAMGRTYGLEFSASHKRENASASLTGAYSRAQGKNIEWTQINFSAAELTKHF
jgi:hypothetical protein